MPGKGRKRPRFSIPRNGWRLLGEPASPTRDQPSPNDRDWMDSDEEDLERTLQDAEEANNEIRDQHHTEEDEKTTGAATAGKDPATLISPVKNVQADVSENLPAESVGDAKSLHPVEQPAPSVPQPAHPPSVPIQVMSPPEDHSESAYSADRGDRLPTDTPRLHPLASSDLPTPSPIVSTSISTVGYSFGPSSAQQDHPNALVTEDTSNALQATEMAAAPEVQEHPLHEDDLSKNVEIRESRAEEMAVDVQQAVPLESQFEFVPQVSGFTAMNVDRPSVSQTIPSQGDSMTNFIAAQSNEDQTKLTDVEIVRPDTASISGDESDQGEERDEVEMEEQREVDDEEEEEELEELEDDEQEAGDEADAEEEDAMDERHKENEVISIASDETSEANDAKASVIDAEEQAEVDEEGDEEDDRSDKLGNVPRETYDITDSSEYDEEEDNENEEHYGEDMSEDEYESEEDVSETESDQEEDEGDVVRSQQQQQPQRTVHPEVIVIDSDSDEEPAPPPAQGRQDIQPTQLSEDIQLRSPRAMQQESDYRSTEESDSEDEEVAESEAEQELSDDYGQQEETVTSEVDASSDAEPRSDEEDDELIEESMSITDDHVSQDGDNYIPPESEDEKSQAQAVATESSEAAMHPELLGTQPSFGVSERLSGPERRPPEASQNVHHDANQVPSDEEAMSIRQATEDSKDKTHSVSHLESGQQLISPEPSQLENVNQMSTHQTVSGTWMPIPQATQDAETHPLSQEPLAGPSSHTEHTPDEIKSLERPATPNPSRPRWTDGPSYSPSPQQRADDTHSYPAGNKEDGDVDDVHAAQDSVDEAVQVDEDSTRENVDTERPSPEALKALPQPNRRATGLRSRMSYFAPLATLVDWFNSMADTISVAVEVSPVARATSGPRDYYLTLRLTDPSMAGTTLPAQIFRTNKTALPAVLEGDVILLRNFKVQSFNHSMMLLSTDSSAWAVFHGEAKEPRVTGPPVEYGPEERTYVADLQNWYCNDGAAMVADHMLQSSIDRGIMEEYPSSVASSEVGSIDSSLRGSSSVQQRSRRGKRYHRRITIHELRDGRKYPEVGSPSDKDSIHELRDGTVYAHSFETD